MRELCFTTTAIVSLVVLSCAPRATLDDKGCPCADGYVCCAVLDRCLSPLEACGPGGGTGGTAGGQAGANGSGGMSASGGEGGSIGSGSGGDQGMAIPRCTLWATQGELEERFLVPTCGKPILPGDDPLKAPACHNGSFVPKMDVGIYMADELLAADSATVRKRLSCKADPWIDRADWTKSNVLTKSDPSAPDGPKAIKCSNGASGMLRMPASVDITQAPPLTREQFDCLRWYVFKLATTAAPTP
jgi:hypothetical protein